MENLGSTDNSSHESFYGSDLEARREGLKIALELIKQQITLATIVVGLSIRFDSKSTSVNIQDIVVLKIGIALMVVSFILGIFALSSIAYAVRKNRSNDIVQQKNVKRFSVGQGLFFVSGVISLSVFVIFN